MNQTNKQRARAHLMIRHLDQMMKNPGYPVGIFNYENKFDKPMYDLITTILQGLDVEYKLYPFSILVLPLPVKDNNG